MKHNLIVNTENIRNYDDLLRLQNLPLVQKIELTRRRVHQFCTQLQDRVYIAYSGGKDSTVLKNIIHRDFPQIPLVFCDTGLEYPEVRDFVKKTEGTIWLKPKMSFKKVLEIYGYPVISKENSQKIYEIRNTKSEVLLKKRLQGDENGVGKLPNKWLFAVDAPFKISHKCCDILKKNPSKKYEKETGRSAITGEMAEDSRLRKKTWLRQGCNHFTGRVKSKPLSFWTQQDIWKYIHVNNLAYSSIYDKGYSHTGCMFCLFGATCKGNNGRDRFTLMKQTHPTYYKYCMDTLGLREVLAFFDKHLEANAMKHMSKRDKRKKYYLF